MNTELLELSDERDLQQQRLLDAERTAYLLGYADGYDQRTSETDRAWAAMPVQRVPEGPALAASEAARFHVCCRACRTGGCRKGCPDCQQRTRETFADPHPDDYEGGPR